MIQSRVSQLKRKIEQLGHDRKIARLEEEKQRALREGRVKITRTMRLPSSLKSAGVLDKLIQDLQALKAELSVYSEIDVTIEIEG